MQVTCWSPSNLKIVNLRFREIPSLSQENACFMILTWITGRDFSDFRINTFVSSDASAKAPSKTWSESSPLLVNRGGSFVNSHSNNSHRDN